MYPLKENDCPWEKYKQNDRSLKEYSRKDDLLRGFYKNNCQMCAIFIFKTTTMYKNLKLILLVIEYAGNNKTHLYNKLYFTILTISL